MATERCPQVSIVTPVFNGEPYLRECIESVLAQTYTNWDYTILDNCSTDRSVEIAREYAARDSRIRVCQNSRFLEALANHNAGLREIAPASEYCKVVFADDWLFPECLTRMVAVAERHPSVALVGAYSLEGDRVTCTGLPYTSEVFSGREICRRHLLEALYLFGSATSVLYRSDLIRERDPFFDETNIHADTEVCFELLKKRDFGFVHQVLTYTRVRPGSLNTVSTSRGTHLAGMLRVLVAHGPAYLTDAELSAQLDRHIATYYRFLGKSLFTARDKTFWDFHKKELLDLRFGFSRMRLLRGAIVNACLAALHPQEALVKLKTRVHIQSGS